MEMLEYQYDTCHKHNTLRAPRDNGGPVGSHRRQFFWRQFFWRLGPQACSTCLLITSLCLATRPRATIASRVNSSACREARSIHANYGMWHPISQRHKTDSLAYSQEVQSACAAPQHCLHYVRNQKAGSESMLHNLGRACAANEYCKAHALHLNSQSWGGPRTWPGLWRRPFAAPGLSWHRHFEREPAWPPAGDVSFTVVREPIATAVAAYLEISRRPDGLAETAKSAYRSMARNNCSAPNARFEAFLDDIERRRNLGNQAFHANARAGARSKRGGFPRFRRRNLMLFA